MAFNKDAKVKGLLVVSFVFIYFLSVQLLDAFLIANAVNSMGNHEYLKIISIPCFALFILSIRNEAHRVFSRARVDTILFGMFVINIIVVTLFTEYAWAFISIIMLSVGLYRLTKPRA